jgi:hypothetical protein
MKDYESWPATTLFARWRDCDRSQFSTSREPMEINSGRHHERASTRTPVQAGNIADSPLTLEVKLRRLHQRRRRAAMRRLMRIAFWSAGALGVAAFMLALGNAAPK